MSRIRTIKPEFFTSANIICMSPLSRLFYASLWCEADREGRLKWDVKTLKFRYFPADDCDIDLLAQELIDGGLIELYEVDGKIYAQIPTFTEHQVINNREQESTIPPKPSKTEQKADASFTRESGDQGEGKEGRKGKEGASKRETLIPENFSISENVREWAKTNGHDQLDTHLSNFIDSCKAKSYKYRDWDAAFRKAISMNWAKVDKKSASVHVMPSIFAGAR